MSWRFWKKNLEGSSSHFYVLQNCFTASNSLSFTTISIFNPGSIILPIHHIVLGVNHLEKAIKDFEQLGFTVSPGGQHTGGFSHNALIHFSDGTFLELFAFRKSIKTYLLRLADSLGLLEKRKKLAHLGYMPRFMKGLHGKEGAFDFAMLLEDIDQYTDKINYGGVGPALSFSRLRPDGVELSWKLAFPKDLQLPFLMSPYHPPQEVPKTQKEHVNGSMAIRQLDLSVKDWDAYFQHYLELLQTTPQVGREAKEPKARFSIKTQDIVLKSAEKAEGIQKIYVSTQSSDLVGKELSCHNTHIAFVPA